MKVKTSIALSKDLLEDLDALARPASSRSRLIEQAIVEFLDRQRRAAREARDLEILNRSAEALNRDMEEILAFQAEL